MRNLTVSLNNHQLKLLDSVLIEGESYYQFCKNAILKAIDRRNKHKTTSKGKKGEGASKNQNHDLEEFVGADLNEKQKRLSGKSRS